MTADVGDEYIAEFVCIVLRGDPIAPTITGGTWPLASVTRQAVGVHVILFPSPALTCYASADAPQVTLHEHPAPAGCSAVVVRTWDAAGGQPADPSFLVVGGLAAARDSVKRLARGDEVARAAVQRTAVLT